MIRMLYSNVEINERSLTAVINECDRATHFLCHLCRTPVSSILETTNGCFVCSFSNNYFDFISFEFLPFNNQDGVFFFLFGEGEEERTDTIRSALLKI